MCFDCLLPKVSANKTLMGRLSRQNTTGADLPDGYGPPLKFNSDPEDLPLLPETWENDSKEVHKVDSDESSGNTQEGTKSEESVWTRQQVYQVNAKPDQDKFVYEQNIEVETETSLDDQLPIGENTDSEVTNDTLSTLQSDQKLEDAGSRWTENGRWIAPGKAVTDGQKTGQSKNVGQLEVVLEYEEMVGRLKVAIMKATNLLNKKQGGFNNYRIRFSLRPNKQRNSKTLIRPFDSAVFREIFRFRDLPKEELPVLEILFKLHGCGKFGKERVVGDAILNLSAMKDTAKKMFNIPLVQRVYE